MGRFYSWSVERLEKKKGRLDFGLVEHCPKDLFSYSKARFRFDLFSPFPFRKLVCRRNVENVVFCVLPKTELWCVGAADFTGSTGLTFKIKAAKMPNFEDIDLNDWNLPPPTLCGRK